VIEDFHVSVDDATGTYGVLSIDATTGQVDVTYSDDEGEQKTESEKMELPDDLANGMVSTLLKNVTPEAPPRSVSYVAATPKPRLVKLEIATAPQERFSTGRRGRSPRTTC